MTYEIRIDVPPEVDPDVLHEDITALEHDQALDASEPELLERSDSKDRVRATYYFSDTANRETVVDDVVSVIEEEDWYRVRHRHTYQEYDDELIADEDYYPSHLSNTLRSDPSYDRKGNWEIEVSASYVAGGDEGAETKRFEFSQPDDGYIQRHTVVATSDGLVVIDGDAQPRPIKVGAYPERGDLPEDSVVILDVEMKESVDQIPRSGIKTAEQVGERESYTTIEENTPEEL